MIDKCLKCGSNNLKRYLTIPERKTGTLVGKCLDCGAELRIGKSIFK